MQQPEQQETSARSRWIFLFLLLLILFLLSCILILSLIFFKMVPSDFFGKLRPTITTVVPVSPDESTRISTAGGTSCRTGPLGASGRKRKYGYKIPSSVAPGQAPAYAAEHELGRADQAVGNMPLAFEEYCEEYGGNFDFSAQGAGFNIQMGAGELCLDLKRPEVNVPENQKVIYKPRGRDVSACDVKPSVRICMRMPNANGAAQAAGLQDKTAAAHDDSPESRLRRWHGLSRTNAPVASINAAAPRNRKPADLVRGGDLIRNNFLVGSDPGQWFTDLPAFATVQYQDIYPGIDMNCYGDQNRMEYVFVIWPGADPASIEFTFDGVDDTFLDANGNIEVHFECGKIVMRAPLVSQIVEGRAVPVQSSFIFDSFTRSYRFAVAPYVTDKPLVAQPALDYQSYLGGTGTDRGYAVAVDDAGFGYIAGESSSTRFGLPRSAEKEVGNNVDVFVTKFRIADSRPVYTTFLGGFGDDRALGLAPAPDGGIYVCGETMSENFPTTNSIASLKTGASWDVFLTHLDADGLISGTSLRWGGTGDERAYAVAVDAEANVYVAGETSSPDFPSTTALHSPAGIGRIDAFVARINPVAHKLDYVTTVGGSGENAAFSLAVDSRQCAYIAGQTSSQDFPVARPFQRLFAGGVSDAFAAKLTADGQSLHYATYLGGSGDDSAYGIAVDSAGQAYIAGESSSSNYPTSNALQPAHGGGYWDATLTKLNVDGNSPVYSTYFGSDGDDRAFAVAADAAGAAHLVGATTSSNLPSVKAVQGTYGGGSWDGFAVRLEAAGTTVGYATWVGGRGDDFLYSVAIDGSRLAHVAGATTSTNLLVTRPLQTANRGGAADALLAAIRPEYRAGPELCLVPGGGQMSGPQYDFYMSKYELQNEEFVRFLNDAQANTNNFSGTNMYFDAAGNAWLNPAMVAERDELFTIADSRVVYRRESPPGRRYSVTPKAPPNGGSYANHPISGVSWYGSLKYCNWLTLDTGRGPDQRCFREGTNVLDWAPVTCSVSNWSHGLFTDEERTAWLSFKGFRLPMDNAAGTQGSSNTFLRVPNVEFTRFLNDAQINPDNARGTNLYFDAVGNVWISPACLSGRDEAFLVGDSRLMYIAENPAGRRYVVTRAVAPDGGTFEKYPVTGVSWLGAMKYCNWMTLNRGQGADARCYSEGPTPSDWTPVTLAKTNWLLGNWTSTDQRKWADTKHGASLPYLATTGMQAWADTYLAGAPGTNNWANSFNEYFKASAWNGKTNMNYGFGRDTCDARDANFLDSGAFAWHDTSPGGYYDGTSHNGVFQTRTNENPYGIYDLGGNVSEWLTDPGRVSSPLDRACYGGSWMFEMTTLQQRQFVHPYFTDSFRGFRVVTVASEAAMYAVRIPCRICLCSYGTGAGCGRNEASDDTSTEGGGKDGGTGDGTDDGRTSNERRDDTTTDSNGVMYRRPVGGGGGGGGDGEGGGDGGGDGGGGGPRPPPVSPSWL